jgi:hypothetical protein
MKNDTESFETAILEGHFEGGAVWGEESARDSLSVSSDAERALQNAWRTKHGCKDTGRHRAHSARGDQAPAVFEAAAGGSRGLSKAVTELPRDAESDWRLSAARDHARNIEELFLGIFQVMRVDVLSIPLR